MTPPRVRQKPERGQEPVRIRHQQQAQRLDERVATIRQIPKEMKRYRQNRNANEFEEEPP
jgi:hypothetical protein